MSDHPHFADGNHSLLVGLITGLLSRPAPSPEDLTLALIAGRLGIPLAEEYGLWKLYGVVDEAGNYTNELIIERASGRYLLRCEKLPGGAGPPSGGKAWGPVGEGTAPEAVPE